MPATGRDLPDAGGPGFLTLNGRIGETNRSLIGQQLPFRVAVEILRERPFAPGKNLPEGMRGHPG